MAFLAHMVLKSPQMPINRMLHETSGIHGNSHRHAGELPENGITQPETASSECCRHKLVSGKFIVRKESGH